MTSTPSIRMLWWRWSLRDLRQRWVSVLAIATVIAIGVGVFAGLGSTGVWRRISQNESYAQLHMHDLKVSLSPGTTTRQGQLVSVISALPSAASVAAVEERLIVPTQVDASDADRVVLVPGSLIGANTSPTAAVDALSISRGARPETTVEGAPTQVVLEEKFADHYALPTGGTVELAGGVKVNAVGHGVSPEYFLVTGASDAGFLAEASYAVLFGSLADVQRISGLTDQVNDAVILLRSGADRAKVETELKDALSAVGTLSATVEARDQDPSYRMLYDDINGDQQMWNAISALILIAASVAAFNLIGRIVDAQRREIGVQMALGVPPKVIMRRPILVAAQIALLGTLLGVVVGALMGIAMRALFTDLLPLPVWQTPFQPRIFLGAAALGFVLPFVASVLPVWRAVRVEPVDAIRTAHLAVRGTRMASISKRLRLRRHPNALRLLPLRNVMRAPRRTLLTALGVGAAIAALVGVLGMLDSFNATIRGGERELLRAAADRVTVQLDTFQPVSGEVVKGIATSPEVQSVQANLQLPATARTQARSEELDLIVTVLDLSPTPSTGGWSPTVRDVAPANGNPGIVLAAKGASDLGVRPGDVVIVRHPVATGITGYALRDTTFTVIGVHPSPLRSLAFVSTKDQSTFGLAGITNVLEVRPAAGVSDDALRRALFTQAGVASTQSIMATTSLFREALKQFLSILLVAAVAVLLLALLIAFNSTSIAVDERTREHATMFAFGLPTRTVVGEIAKESVLVGVFSTLTGLGIGFVLLRWMIDSVVASTAPDFGFVVAISPLTFVIALIVGVAAVGLTPLFLIRRLRRMNIPDALRVME